ncbi:hypothetical protein AAC387_Pa04g1073 [Persea americana]
MLIPMVQVNTRSALNLITVTALQELGMPPNKLTSTNTATQGYDGEVQNPIRKIQIKFQLGYLASEELCTSSKLERAIIFCSKEDGYMITPLYHLLLINVSNLLMMMKRCIVFSLMKSLLKEKRSTSPMRPYMKK